MSRLEDEQRAIRVGLASFLQGKGWTNLNYEEGWGERDIEKPLVNVYILDDGKSAIELGHIASTHKLFNRTAQIDVFMESESRVKTLCDDIMDYIDLTSFTIIDLFTTSGVGYLTFPDTNSIRSNFLPPSFNNPEILRWRGSVRGDIEAYYPNGGDPI